MAISIKNKLGLTSKILIGMGTGIALGLILRNAFPESDMRVPALRHPLESLIWPAGMKKLSGRPLVSVTA